MRAEYGLPAAVILGVPVPLVQRRLKSRGEEQ